MANNFDTFTGECSEIALTLNAHDQIRPGLMVSLHSRHEKFKSLTGLSISTREHEIHRAYAVLNIYNNIYLRRSARPTIIASSLLINVFN